MAEILLAIHQLMRTRADSHLTTKLNFLNDDLRGFFTSVPHALISEAGDHLVFEYVRHHPAKMGIQEVIFTVPLKISAKSRLIRGKSFTRSTTNQTIRLLDLPQLISMALELSFFTCMGKVYQQDRGAIIGGQASPALCALAVTYKEHVWIKAYHITKHSGFLCIRYVDNRLTVIEDSLQSLSSYKRFTSLQFYEDPVELEACGTDEFLGYQLDFANCTCLYKIPDGPYHYRSTRSAGSAHRILSGLQARIHLLYRGTFPRTEAPRLLNELLENYVARGFTMQQLRSVSFRISAAYATKPK